MGMGNFASFYRKHCKIFEENSCLILSIFSLAYSVRQMVVIVQWSNRPIHFELSCCMLTATEIVVMKHCRAQLTVRGHWKLDIRSLIVGKYMPVFIASFLRMRNATNVAVNGSIHAVINSHVSILLI